MMDPCAFQNYSYSYKDDNLCFETGYFGLKVNSSNLTEVSFGVFNDEHGDLSYLQALPNASSQRMDTQLDKEQLIVEIIPYVDDNDSTCRSDAASHRVVSAGETRLWESGMICQHYDFKQLQFKSTTGDTDGDFNLINDYDTTLYILVWPDSMAFTFEMKHKEHEEKGAQNQALQTSGFSIRMKMKSWEVCQKFDGSQIISTEILKSTLICDIDDNRKVMFQKSSITCSYVNPRQEFTTEYSDHFNCYLLAKDGLIDRNFQCNYTDIRDYDDFHVQVNNQTDEDMYVPILLFVQYLANATGLCPIVCDMNHEPTGIHIQLSKNWHSVEIRNYGRFYSFLPAKANKTSEYHIRIPYGFYGSLPTASHSNLSLIGYHGHGTRWEQLAIGCWGETICLDIDMGCCQNTITDLRMLFTRGEDKKLWQWSDAGWGGDWLKVHDDDNKRLMPFSWKIAYESHGPCLTCMHVDGFYKSDDTALVEVKARVRTLRTDDYARTFISLTYVFRKDLVTAGTYLFSLGGVNYIETPIVAYGNKDGLQKEIHVDRDIEFNEFFIKKEEISGTKPFFVGFPGQQILSESKWGKGFRALIIRNYHAIFNNVEYDNPCISLIGLRKRPSIKADLQLVLAPPECIELFKNGDQITLDVEVITLPKASEQYYGTNENFRHHLQLFPDSWKSIHRETKGNDVDIDVVGGTIDSKYPVIIKVTNDSEIRVQINGGVGAMPLRFEGLPSVNYILVKSNKNGEERFAPEKYGNDYWQTDFFTDKKFSLTFNIPDEYLAESTWILQRVKVDESKVVEP